ncbi:hypothetical protein [Rhizobium sp. 9140]|uniref:hypothetical protein n=1 Tax=Rhizobium sp. 9140 TaxID=1761900 RepID=UPI00079C939B|nr:hypothetical protein [Rhizobium sp. 9140]CZT36403.1 hypothetical protein GA0004734_00034020 [Rhizobium sp. 9140]
MRALGLFFITSLSFVSETAVAQVTGKIAILDVMIRVKECKITIGPQTQEWLRSLMGELAAAQMAEVRDESLKEKREIDWEQCAKARAQLFRDGWLN